MTAPYKSQPDSEREGWDKLVAFAREINPDLPADVSNCVVTICMSKHGSFATAMRTWPLTRPTLGGTP